MQEAYRYLDKMKRKNIVVTPYLDAHVVESIYEAVGVQMPFVQQDDDGIDEDIREEF